MKNYILSLLLTGSLIAPVVAQVHQEGQTAIEISGGTLDGFKLPGKDNFGYYTSIAYSKYRSRYTYWKAGIHQNQKFYAYDKANVPLTQWLGEVNYFTRAVGRISESWMLNVGIGAAGGYESINQDRSQVEGATIRNASGWVVGPSVSIELEYLISDQIIFLVQAKEYYLLRSSVIPTRFNVGLGLKFILPSDDAQ